MKSPPPPARAACSGTTAQGATQGPGRGGGGTTQTRGVRLPVSLWAEVDRVATAAKRSRNWVIVHALERVLEGRCRNPPDPGECDTVHTVGSSAQDREA